MNINPHIPHTLLRYSLLAIISCFVFTESIFSQPKLRALNTGTIKGTAVDSATKSPVSFVSVTVYDPVADNIIKSIISKEDGSFKISHIPLQQYRLFISRVGYNGKSLSLPSFTSSIIYVGNVPLSAQPVQLKEVVVIAQKQLIEQQINKVVYNVDADPDSKTLNTFDMLRKVPMISLDAEEKLQMNGSSSFRVLINGRASSLFVRNPSDVFKSMPASFIKKIEVITNPPARYEAEGISGIINIITNKKRVSGYNGSLSLGADKPTGYATGSFITAKAGKFGLSVSGGYSGANSPTSNSEFIREDKIVSLNLYQTGKSTSINRSGYISSEFSFEADSLNLFTATYNTNIGKAASDFMQQVELRNKDQVLKQVYNNSNNSTSDWKGDDIGIDFQHSFKNKDRLFTLSYKLTKNYNSGNTEISLRPLLNYIRQESNSYNNNTFNEQTWQADYVQPVKNQMLEFGFKSIVRKNYSNYSYTNRDTVTGTFVTDGKLSNNFDYRQDINSAYISLTLKNNSWSLTTGARLEQTTIDANFKSSGTRAFQKYLNLIPNATVARKVNTSSTVSFSFTQRIERPSLYYLDPFIDISDPRNIYYGNPNLLPAISNAFNLSYFTFIKNTSVSASLFHHFTNNSIERYTTVGKDTIGRTTYGNVGSNQLYGFSVSSNVTAFDRMSISLNSSGNYIKYSSSIIDLGRVNEGFSYDLFGYASYRFNKGWRAGGSITYSSAGILLQGSQAALLTNNLSVTKEFLKDKKANASFTISNPFQKNRRSYTEINDPSFHQLQQSVYVIRRFNIGFHYRFGKLKEDVARKKRGIKNDDLKTEAK